MINVQVFGQKERAPETGALVWLLMIDRPVSFSCVLSSRVKEADLREAGFEPATFGL